MPAVSLLCSSETAIQHSLATAIMLAWYPDAQALESDSHASALLSSSLRLRRKKDCSEPIPLSECLVNAGMLLHLPFDDSYRFG